MVPVAVLNLTIQIGEICMTHNSRRKVLKGIAVTLPAVWTVPVVESVILPVHAGTSTACSIEDIDTICAGLDPFSNENDCTECNERLLECGSDLVINCD